MELYKEDTKKRPGLSRQKCWDRLRFGLYYAHITPIFRPFSIILALNFTFFDIFATCTLQNRWFGQLKSNLKGKVLLPFRTRKRLLDTCWHLQP